MIDTILSNEAFRPQPNLARKYWMYVISIVILVLFFSIGFPAFISVVAQDPLPPGFMIVWLVILGVGITVIIVSYPLVNWYFNSITYEIVEDEVHVFRGVITKTRKIVPYRTITNLDVKRGPYDRLLKLGTIEIQTAGQSGNKVGPEERIDGLPGELVDKIQHILLTKVRRMRGSPGTSHDVDDEHSLLADILHEIRELRKQLSNN